MNMLQKVVERMNAPGKGRELKSVASAVGVGYFTAGRIKHGKGDPGYSTVQKFYDYYFPAESPKVEAND